MIARADRRQSVVQCWNVRNVLLEVLRSSVQGYLGNYWFSPDAIRWLSDRSARPEKLTNLYEDATYTSALDLAKHIFERSMLITGQESTYRVVAALAPDAGPEQSLLCMTDDRELLLILRTSALRHEDGTVQIYGAEPSVTLLTANRLREQFNNKLIGGDNLRSFRFEVRDGDLWRVHPHAAVIAEQLIGGLPGVEREVAPRPVDRSPPPENHSPTARRMLTDTLTGVLRFASRALRSKRAQRQRRSP